MNSDFNRDEDEELFSDFAVGDDDEFYDNLANKPVMSPWEKSYDELRETMIKLPTCNIWKKIVKAGIGEPMPQEKIRATIHYNGYFEQTENRAAFDSTYMRGAPKTFYIGNNEILTGIELAVMSMLKNEESQFIVSYELLFGEMGCQPRVPPKADGLFVISLLNFTEVGDGEAIDKVKDEDKRKFAVILPKIQDVQTKGKDLFNRGHTANSIRAFHNAVRTLEMCQLSNEEEQQQHQQLLAKLYTNLAVCYNKLGLWKKTCSICNELNRISDKKKNGKALFQEGRALLKLNEFRRAREKLGQAQRLEPTNKMISDELILLEQTYKKQKDFEQGLWKRAFKNDDATKENKKPDVDDSFQATLLEHMDQFKADTKQRAMRLPEGLSSEELESIESMVQNMSLKLEVVQERNRSVHQLVKK